MKVDWTSGPTKFNLSKMTMDEQGHVLLAFHRYPVLGDGRMWVLARADGPVVNALLEPVAYSGCYVASHELGSDRYVLDISGNAPTGKADLHFAHIISGAVGGPPALVFKQTNPSRELGAWTTFSDELVVRWDLGRLSVTDWGFQGDVTITDPDGLGPYESIVDGSSVIFAVRGGGNSGVMSWTPQDGLRGLLRWPGDLSKGAGNLGTDGKVMVWTQGEGKPPGGWYGDYASFSIMTAPFSTDPAQVASTARRLRSEARGQVAGRDEAWKVGCGYAARAHYWLDALEVVRLADGAAWILPSTASLKWGPVLGVTCEEVFVSAGTSDGERPARVGIGSLGVPLPAD